jgi:hypothetical protein
MHVIPSVRQKIAEPNGAHSHSRLLTLSAMAEKSTDLTEQSAWLTPSAHLKYKFKLLEKYCRMLNIT